MAADLTAIAGNPASRIRARYEELMAIECVDTLKRTALEIAGQGGMSKKNHEKFIVAVQGEAKIDRLRFYLTNFLLAGAGLSVGAGSRLGRAW